MKNKIVIIGLGKTGLSVARYLASQKIPFAINDTRDNPPGLIEFKEQFPNHLLVLGKLDEELIQSAEELIVNPGLSIKTPIIAKQINKGKKVIGDIELFVQAAKAPIVAITGSNGKTTVTTLLGLMVESAGLKVQVCGNIGVPVLDLLNEPTPDFYIMELSSFQLETTCSLKAKAATVLNISEDHMDRYDSLAEYADAKKRIFQNCDVGIVNLDDKLSYADVAFKQDPLTFSMYNQAADFYLQSKNNVLQLMHRNQLLISSEELPLNALHHCQNALAAMALGYAMGLPTVAMLKVLRTFLGLPHRCQLVVKHNDIQWINDSKATNVGAAVAAINSIGKSTKGSIILLAGGDGKAADFSPLFTPIKEHVSQAILFGQDASLIEQIINGVTTVSRSNDLVQAVQLAAKLAKPGDTILLSPACASFDMFNNFEHRGESFAKAVFEVIS